MGKNVYGGRDDKAAVTNNDSNNNWILIANAYGGAGSDYDVSNNHIIVDGGTVTNSSARWGIDR